MSQDLLHVELVFRSAVSYYLPSFLSLFLLLSFFAAVKVTETFVAYFKARM